MEEIRLLEKMEHVILHIYEKEILELGVNGFFSIKYKADGIKERYKDHFIAKGFTQIYEIDYTEILYLWLN